MQSARRLAAGGGVGGREVAARGHGVRLQADDLLEFPNRRVELALREQHVSQVVVRVRVRRIDPQTPRG